MTAPGPGEAAPDRAQLFRLIAPGRVTAVVPESGRLDRRQDLTAVHVVYAPTVTTGIGMPAGI